MPRNTIKFGYIGPTKFIIGQECALTADIAVEDINKAGGIKIGGKKYKVELVKVDSNEILNVADAVSAMEKTDNRRQGEFIVGGYRSEAVLAMQEVIGDKRPFGLTAIPVHRSPLPEWRRTMTA